MKISDFVTDLDEREDGVLRLNYGAEQTVTQMVWDEVMGVEYEAGNLEHQHIWMSFAGVVHGYLYDMLDNSIGALSKPGAHFDVTAWRSDMIADCRGALEEGEA